MNRRGGDAHRVDALFQKNLDCGQRLDPPLLTGKGAPRRVGINHGHQLRPFNFAINARMMRPHSPHANDRTTQRSIAHAPFSGAGSTDVA